MCYTFIAKTGFQGCLHVLVVGQRTRSITESCVYSLDLPLKVYFPKYSTITTIVVAHLCIEGHKRSSDGC